MTAALHDKTSYNARGGTTDVGQHTGSTPRGTCVPLVNAVICELMKRQKAIQDEGLSNTKAVTNFLDGQVMLTYGDGATLRTGEEIFDSLWVQLLLWITQRQLGVTTANRAEVDVIMVMLKTIAKEAKRLSDKQEILKLRCACEDIRKKLDGVVGAHFNKTMSESFLPNSLNCPLVRDLRFSICALPNLEKTVTEDKSALIRSNIRSVNLIRYESEGYPSLLAHTSGDLEPLIAISEIEKFICNKFSEFTSTTMIDFFEPLERIFVRYRELHHRVGDSESARSRITVIGWAAYCIAFHSARAKVRSPETYGVCLDHSKLCYLVLEDYKLEQLALKVADYLKKHTTRKPLFNLSDSQSTLEFASMLTRSDAELNRLWLVCRSVEEVRIQSHWKKVEEKKEEVIRLEKELESINNQLDEKKREKIAFEREPFRSYRDLNDIQDRISALGRSQSSLDYQLQSAKTPPTPAIMLLPRDEQASRAVFLFIHMPEHARVLSNLSCACQSLLFASLMAVSTSGRLWWEHFKVSSQRSWGSHQTEAYSHGEVELCSPYATARCFVRQGSEFHSVMDMTNREADVFYPGPDSRLRWNGTNPFSETSSNEITTKFFTKIVAPESKLNDFVYQFGTDDPERGVPSYRQIDFKRKPWHCLAAFDAQLDVQTCFH